MSWALSSKNGVRSRKPKRCCLCGEIIAVGELKDTRSGVSDGSFWTMHMHPECHAYERRPGTVADDWYDDISEPAFTRAEASAAINSQKP